MKILPFCFQNFRFSSYFYSRFGVSFVVSFFFRKMMIVEHLKQDKPSNAHANHSLSPPNG